MFRLAVQRGVGRTLASLPEPVAAAIGARSARVIASMETAIPPVDTAKAADSFGSCGTACRALASPLSHTLGAGPFRRSHASSRDGRLLREASHDEFSARSIAPAAERPVDPTPFYEALRGDIMAGSGGVGGGYPSDAPRRLVSYLTTRLADLASASAISQGPLRLYLMYMPSGIAAQGSVIPEHTINRAAMEASLEDFEAVVSAMGPDAPDAVTAPLRLSLSGVVGPRLAPAVLHVHHCPLTHMGPGWAPVLSVNLQESVFMANGGYEPNSEGVFAYVRDAVESADWSFAASMVRSAAETCTGAVADMAGTAGDAERTRAVFEEMHHLDTVGYRSALTHAMSGDEIRAAAMQVTSTQFKHEMFKNAKGDTPAFRRYKDTVAADAQDPIYLEEREAAVNASKARVLSELVESERRFAEKVDILRREVRRSEGLARKRSAVETAKGLLSGLVSQ